MSSLEILKGKERSKNVHVDGNKRLYNCCGKRYVHSAKKLQMKLPWKTMKVLVVQLCLTLWDPMDSNLPGFSLYRILQARIVEWVVIPFSRGSFWSRDRTWTWLSHFAGCTIWASRIKLPDPAISLLVIQPKGLGAVLKRYWYIHIHSSIIHNS